MKKGMKILTALSVAFMFTLSSYAAGKDLLKSNIPQIYGKAKGASEGSSDLTIIHIQDAHGNVEAQENIQSIIKTLAEQGKIEAISDEGRATVSNMEGFNSVSEEDAELVADFWTKYDLFNGALRYNALDDRKMTVFGNEDMSYYNQGLEAFKNSHSNKKESMAAAEKIKGAMEALKLKIFDDNSRKFLQTLEDFANDKITLTTYAKALQVEADNAKVKWNTYHNFSKVVESIKLEDGIDFAKIDRERLDLVDELETKVDKKISDEIVTKSLNYRLGRLSAADYYEFLLKQSKDAKIDMTKYENVVNYSKLVKLYAEINDDELFAESERLENAVKAVLFKTDAQINFDKHFKNLEVLTKMISLEMTRADLAFYSENKPSAAQAIAFLKNEAKSLNLGIEINEAFGKIDQNLASNEKFYQIAMKRDEVMVEKTLAMMDERGFKTVVLVAGGFHTEGIIKALQAKTVSHMIITPRITNPDAPNYWLQNMTGEETEATKMLKEISATTMATGKPTDAATKETIRWTADKLKAQTEAELTDATTNEAKIRTTGDVVDVLLPNGSILLTEKVSPTKNISDIFGNDKDGKGLDLRVADSKDLEINGAPAIRQGNVVIITQGLYDLIQNNQFIAQVIIANEGRESRTDGSAKAIADVNKDRPVSHEVLIQNIGLLNKVITNGNLSSAQIEAIANDLLDEAKINANLAANPIKGTLSTTNYNDVVTTFNQIMNASMLMANEAFNKAFSSATNAVVNPFQGIPSSEQLVIRTDENPYNLFTDKDGKVMIGADQMKQLFAVDVSKGGYVKQVQADNIESIEQVANLYATANPGVQIAIHTEGSSATIFGTKNTVDLNKVSQQKVLVLSSANLAEIVKESGLKSNNIRVFSAAVIKAIKDSSNNEIDVFQVDSSVPDVGVYIAGRTLIETNDNVSTANAIIETGVFDVSKTTPNAVDIVVKMLEQKKLPNASPTMKAFFEAMSAAVVFAIAA